MTAPDSPGSRVTSQSPAAESPVARQRRGEIVDAASEIITQEGLHRLSLSRIERRAKMSRGQLTYYFPTKEEILLAVFDRMLLGIFAEVMADAERLELPLRGPDVARTRIRHGIERILGVDGEPDPGAVLGPLVHTFIAQAAHRPDYRARLAETNAGWRHHVAADIAAATPDSPHLPAAVASVVMALFQGLRDQIAVDPAAFDRKAVAAVCVAMLAPFVTPEPEESAR